MKTRLAIIATLVLGMLFSTAGAGLAVGGLGDDDQASVAQYGGNDKDKKPGGQEVLGESESGGAGGGESESGGAGGGNVAGAEQTQFTGQAGGGGLPFTGFAALPVLLVGLALLAGGTVLLRRTGTGRRGG